MSSCEESDWIVLQAFLTRDSSSNAMQDNNIMIGPTDMAVLHLAYFRGMSLSMIESLIDGNANCASSCDDCGKFPMNVKSMTKSTTIRTSKKMGLMMLLT